ARLLATRFHARMRRPIAGPAHAPGRVTRPRARGPLNRSDCVVRIRAASLKRRDRLLDDLAIDHRIPEAPRVGGVESGQLGAVDQEESPIANVLPGDGADLRTHDVEGAPGVAGCQHAEVTLPYDLEETDGDPDGILVSSRRGEVHDPLHHLQSPV